MSLDEKMVGERLSTWFVYSSTPTGDVRPMAEVPQQFSPPIVRRGEFGVKSARCSCSVGPPLLYYNLTCLKWQMQVLLKNKLNKQVFVIISYYVQNTILILYYCTKHTKKNNIMLRQQ